MKQLIIYFLILLKISCIPKENKEKRKLQNSKSNDIVILHTNDVHCGAEDNIGYDGLMLYKKQLLEKYNNVLLVDAGDHIQGGIIGLITNGEAIIDIMNKLQYDAVTLGNHEFDYGIPTLETLEKLLNCSYISTNYCFRANKTCIYPPYKIIEINDKKIGFIGVATPQTLTKTKLISYLDNNGELIYDFLIGNNTQNLYNRVQEHINELKEQNVDYIIIIGHLGIGGDASEEHNSEGLLKHLKNVDAFIDGHTHLVYSKYLVDKEGKPVLIAQTGTKLANIGVLIIHENGTITQENINKIPYEPNLSNQTLNITRNRVVTYVDKEMNEFINNITNSFSDALKRVIGYTSFPLKIYRYKNSNETSDNIILSSRLEENSFCNLVTDSLRKYGEADITIINAASVRSDIKEGNIKYQDIINTMPFSNDVIFKQITGQTVLDALEFGTRFLPTPTSKFPQVSGISYKIDTSIQSSVVVDENEVFQSVGGERRIYGVKINGQNLDVNKNYTISSHSYILEGGGGYSMFIPFEIMKTSIGVDNEVLLKYIESDLNRVIPDKYKESEGRIIKTNGKIVHGDSNAIQISLLGFNNLSIINNSIGFNTYIFSLENITFEFPREMILSTSTFNSKLRVLSDNEKNISCVLENDNINVTKAKYLCEININNSNINTIQINNPYNDNFLFKISPLASKYMSNLTNILNSSESLDLDNKNISILNNATFIHNKNTNSIIISGIINSNKSISFSDNELTLIANKLSDDNNVEIKCNKNNIEGNNYSFICTFDKSLECQLDNSLLIDENNLLLIFFEEGNNTIITSSNHKRINSRNINKGLSSGLIALLIIVIVVAIAVVSSIILLLKKSNTQGNNVDSARDLNIPT